MTSRLQMRAVNGGGTKLKKFEDIVFMDIDQIDPQLGMGYVKHFKYKQGDILLCTFPKTGTHWMGNMIWKLKSMNENDRSGDTLMEFVPNEFYDSQNEPRIMFTHQKPSRLYPDHIAGTGKIVLMLRNPKDSAVSYFYHLKNATLIKNKQTWDEYFQSYIEGELPMGSFFTYIREWEQLLKEINDDKINLDIEVFYYEDCLRNPKENLVRLNKYLGFNRDDDYMERVLKETSIAALRKHYEDNAEKLVHELCLNDTGGTVIFRKGVVGDWKNHFTVAQSEFMDKLLEEACQHGLFKFNFEI